MKEIRYFNKKGKAAEACSENVYFREMGDYGFYSLAAGTHSRAVSGVDVRNVQKAAADAFEELPEYFFQESVGDIKDVMIEIMQEVLYNLTKKSGNAKTYDGTLLILLISRTHNRCRWFHLGEGLMVQEDFAGGLKVMSHPQKGMLQLMGGTVISSPWEQLLRIGENTLQGIRSFFLFTEGAISLFYRNRELTENGKDFLRRGTEVFGRILDQLEMEEDYSILEITIQGDK